MKSLGIGIRADRVYVECMPVDLKAVERCYRLIGLRRIEHFNEGGPARATGATVGHEIYPFFLAKGFQQGASRAEIQVADEDILRTPSPFGFD